MDVRQRAVVPKGQEEIDRLLRAWLLHNDGYELHYEKNSPPGRATTLMAGLIVMNHIAGGHP